MTVASVARTTIGMRSDCGSEAVEQVVAGDRRAARASYAPCPEIVEQQRREDHGEPADPDRQRAEMAHIGVHRLPAGHDQHQRAEHQEGLENVAVAEEHDP